ncbi:hypothetical protein [Actinoplanes sp. NPDC049599]|uniref:hypothetical protein n=1 Tax=Actinoplanes sp. NPDC049599 TaxID=3363903 RepID=UPI0037B0AD51
MAITRAGQQDHGADFADLAGYVRGYEAGGYPVALVSELVCRECRGTVFRVFVDDDEGCAVAVCQSCKADNDIADSAEYFADAELGECACPCGGEEFAAAVGFARHADGEVQWVSLGLRCLTDGTLGVYTDWKIDYGPTAHLLSQHPS